MQGGRGALIVLEGCDRVGKSTQAKMLVKALNERQIPAEVRSFPDRSTPIGEVINKYLSKKEDLVPEAAALLFSANRWECKQNILDSLQAGITLIVDRYAASGAVYAAANTGKDLNWCKEPDKGLPSPDYVALLQISDKCRQSRSRWGEERFENTRIQGRVAANFEKLMDDSWEVINAERNQSEVHSDILQRVLNVIQRVRNRSIGVLYKLDY